MPISIEDVFKPANVNEAIIHLQKKHDGCGVDGVKLSELPQYWKINKYSVINALKNGTYEPEIVQNVEIIGANRKRRMISKLASVDRLILRYYAQKLSEIAQKDFSGFSYDFQEGKGHIQQPVM